MLIEEGTSANLESVPEMPVGNVMPEFNLGLGNGGVDADLGVAIGLTIWYKILFGILGGILALAILFKIIGGCYRVSARCDYEDYNGVPLYDEYYFYVTCKNLFIQDNNVLRKDFFIQDDNDVSFFDDKRKDFFIQDDYGVSFNDKLKNLFIEDDRPWLKLNAILTGDPDNDDKAYEKHGAAYKLVVTTLYDIRNGSVVPFIKLKNKIAGLPKTMYEEYEAKPIYRITLLK